MNIISTQYTLANRSFEIYLAGCNAQPHCEGCFSPETWDFNIGEPATPEKIKEITNKISEFDSMIDNIWILGGDPIDQNPSELFALVDALRRLNKDLWLFTRHELFENGYLREKYQEFYNVLHFIKYVKTGAYIPEEVVDDYWVNGIRLATNNQKIYTPVFLKGYVQLDLSECDYVPPVAPWSDSAQWITLRSCINREDSIKDGQYTADMSRWFREGFNIQPAPKSLDKFLSALQRVYGRDNHCPCSIPKTEPFRCMCEQFRMETTDGAMCHCGLYKKVKKRV